MIIKGKNYLLNLDNYFVAPDGKQYKAVWGKCEPVHMNDPEKGIGETLHNTRHSANYFVSVDDGKFIVAGCQIHYAVQCDEEPYLEAGSFMSQGQFQPRNPIYIPSMSMKEFIRLTWLDEETKMRERLDKE